jgi:L-asparaginase II
MSHYAPLLERTRGTTVESLHYGAAAVVDSSGKLLASLGDPKMVTFMRSAAKPFQALPFIEHGYALDLGLAPHEIAQICASHGGTDLHAQTVNGILGKLGLDESALQCGTHPPLDKATTERLIAEGKTPTSLRHNCSGKHSGMLAHAKIRGLPTETYLERDHPIQQDILQAFAEMCKIAPSAVQLGTDGCSAPNFATPLYHAAFGFARLCDPRDLPKERAVACQTITSAMMTHPEYVSGFGRFDTRLMQVGGGKFVVKGGAEGYQALGILPNLTGTGPKGVGIALKISDGDPHGTVRAAVMLEILRQLGYLNAEETAALADFAPSQRIYNWRKLEVGESRTIFKMEKHDGRN